MVRIACTKIKVNQSYTPAVMTQERKNTTIFVATFHLRLKKLQTNPATKKSLYNP